MNQRLRGGIVFLVLGIAAAAGGAYLAYPHVQDTGNAEPVDAEILSADSYTVSPPGETNRKHYANVTYRYTYDGETYTSDSLFPGNRDEQVSRTRAEEIASNYTAGDRVTVHALPGDPERSYLIEASMPWWHYLIPGFGVLLIVVAVINVVQGVRGVGPGGAAD